MRYNNFKQSKLYKNAGALGDALISYGYSNPGRAIVPILGTADDLGTIHGMFSSAPSEALEKQWDKEDNELGAFFPGVAASRVERRVKRQATDDSGSTRHYWAQKLAPYLHMAAGAVGGGVIGGALSKKTHGAPTDMGVWGGMGLGALAGAGTWGLGAGLAALTPRRTRQEQRNYANGSTAAEWLVPGAASYNRWKSLGRAVGDSEEHEPKDKKKKSKNEEPKEEQKKAASLYKAAVTLENVKDPKQAVIPYMTDEGKFSPHRTSQALGSLTSLFPATLLCAGLGYGLGKLTDNEPENMALLGGIIGMDAAALANIGGIAGGFLGKRRTSAEENNYLKSPTAADYLIPGVAGYNAAQTYRVNQAEIEDMVAKSMTKNTKVKQ